MTPTVSRDGPGLLVEGLHGSPLGIGPGRHHLRVTGDRPMVVGWAPGELAVLDQGAIA